MSEKPSKFEVLKPAQTGRVDELIWVSVKHWFSGHSQEFACSYSISMTVDVYGHLVPEANRAAMDRLPTVEDPLEEAPNCPDKRGCSGGK